MACRYIVDRDAHQSPGSLTLGLSAATHLQHMLIHVDRAIDFIGGIAVPEQLEPLFTYIDFLDAPDATYELDGRTWSVFVRDWRGLPVDDWFERWPTASSALRSSPTKPAPTTIALSQPDFADAVRRPCGTFTSPTSCVATPCSVLASSTAAGMAAPGPTPRHGASRDGRRAVDPRREVPAGRWTAPSCDPRRTQERAAEVLDLPFSTYRRHLTRGVEL